MIQTGPICYGAGGTVSRWYAGWRPSMGVSPVSTAADTLFEAPKGDGKAKT